MGLWLTNLKKEIVNCKLFNSGLHKNNNDLNDCISFHYLKPKMIIYFIINLHDKY